MDRFDAAILEQLQRNARTTAEQMADLVGLSAAACQKRMRALRQKGHVAQDVAILSPRLAARRLTLILNVTLYGESRQKLAAFAERMKKADEVMQCYRTTGPGHFLLMITVDNMEAFEAFSDQHLTRDDDVERFVTSVVRERVKTTFYQPVSLGPVER